MRDFQETLTIEEDIRRVRIVTELVLPFSFSSNSTRIDGEPYSTQTIPHQISTTSLGQDYLP